MLNIDLVKDIISEIPYIKKIISLKKNNSFLEGKIEILFEGLDKPLEFEFKIYPQYPLKNYGFESIKFINSKLLKYSHVMGDGSICIHTACNKDIRQKLLIDFHSLKNWIEKYYLNNHKDRKYEHIIIHPHLINDKYYSYFFTDVDYKFKKGNFGEVKLSLLNIGNYKNKRINNYLVQSFSTKKEEYIECQWNESYKNKSSSNLGFYIFIEKHPAYYNKFAFQGFNELETYMSQSFLDLIHKFEIKNSDKSKGMIVPIFIGYNTIKAEIYWQVALLEVGKFPIKEDYILKNNILVPIKKLREQEIKWALTRDVSYKLFFGRGSLSTRITNAKVLIIGIGAIGSVIAKSLVKGGCKFVDIADYDIKEPTNVCRSEYTFIDGINDKVMELNKILTNHSPFVHINIFKKEYFEDIIKNYSTDLNGKDSFASILNKYDIIFDCSTDNDLMYLLNLLELKSDLINLSITNHAKDLVCAFYPNIYHFVDTQYRELLNNDLYDMYEPNGCWSPTFKASYIDIAFLAQMALKKINHFYEKNKAKSNFVIKTEKNNNFFVRVEEY